MVRTQQNIWPNQRELEPANKDHGCHREHLYQTETGPCYEDGRNTSSNSHNCKRRTYSKTSMSCKKWKIEAHSLMKKWIIWLCCVITSMKYTRERARCKWLKEGYVNTVLFHKTTNFRRRANMIIVHGWGRNTVGWESALRPSIIISNSLA